MRGTHGILIRRFLTAFVALLALQAGSLVAPAYACGCGAMVPDASRRIGVGREESAVRWDGRTGTIVMRFRVHGDAERAARIMPVPSRADVSLGDPELFDRIDRLTAPERRDRPYSWPREDDWPFDTGHGDGAGAAPGAGAGVGVVGRERPEVAFAGRIERPEGAVAALAGGGPVYLTVLEQEFPNPGRIDDDHHLRRVADAPYREVIHADRLLSVAGLPAWLLTVG
ncbi:DUF2330 domain-containing protein, partial [Streptomyces sp. WAC02707]|uniref:DUF2330 domain-containing protein n=1 Tax=Streptomyces sp. WAC02707 TaxID=2487417 RepID=UPI000F78CD74